MDPSVGSTVKDRPGSVSESLEEQSRDKGKILCQMLSAAFSGEGRRGRKLGLNLHMASTREYPAFTKHTATVSLA